MRACLVLALALLGAGCGVRIVELAPDGVDAGEPDAAGNPCVAGDTQCTNCIDDDGDGDIDGFDVECTGAIDDDEGSFATGIPGDNGGGTSQDCFYDGNSGGGAGGDGCSQHVCCILGLDTQGCADAGFPGSFDPVADCPAVPQPCIDNCTPLVPPGCDCFGCCTICEGATCFDIYIHPVYSPDCDADVIEDPDLCLRCVPSTTCGTGCDGGAAECATSADCGDGLFCAAGCCIDVVD